MLRIRVIPTLLLQNKGLVKTVKFSNPTYIGDPINAVKIFNDKLVDELVFLDIDASAHKKEPDYDYISDIANECFMPICYGGGVKNIEQMRKIFKIGIEKIAINTAAIENPGLIREAAEVFGSQSIVVTITVKKDLFGNYKVYNPAEKTSIKTSPIDYAKNVEALGAGEIMLYPVDDDGTMKGYSLALISKVTSAVKIPVIACGGAKEIADFKRATDAGASAVAAGSLFVYKGPHKAVLINFPSSQELEDIFK
jgi:cyclase